MDNPLVFEEDTYELHHNVLTPKKNTDSAISLRSNFRISLMYYEVNNNVVKSDKVINLSSHCIP